MVPSFGLWYLRLGEESVVILNRTSLRDDQQGAVSRSTTGVMYNLSVLFRLQRSGIFDRIDGNGGNCYPTSTSHNFSGPRVTSSPSMSYREFLNLDPIYVTSSPRFLGGS